MQNIPLNPPWGFGCGSVFVTPLSKVRSKRRRCGFLPLPAREPLLIMIREFASFYALQTCYILQNISALDVSHVVDSVVNGGSEGQGQRKKQVLDASKSYQVYSYSAIPILNRRDVSNFVHHLKKELNC